LQPGANPTIVIYTAKNSICTLFLEYDLFFPGFLNALAYYEAGAVIVNSEV
jgi:hypothetical protein